MCDLYCDGWSTEYTELQPLLSGVHSVMRVESVLAGEGGGARPPPLITFTLTSKVAVYAPAEWADTLTLFHLYQYMYSVVRTTKYSMYVLLSSGNSSCCCWYIITRKQPFVFTEITLGAGLDQYSSRPMPSLWFTQKNKSTVIQIIPTQGITQFSIFHQLSQIHRLLWIVWGLY
jgi:hypothetical protein